LPLLRFDVLTLFPDFFTCFLNSSIIKKAHDKKIIETNFVNFRRFARDKHKTVDDIPYGGREGMVLKPEPVFEAVEDILQKLPFKPPIILMSPKGEKFDFKKARKLAKEKHLIILCGHYAGFDERVSFLATEEISIGDYVLTGGELAAMVLIDSVVRFVPGVLGNLKSSELDSFENGLLEYPQYTRPAIYRGYEVPKVLLSGNHKEIARWKRLQALELTFKRRPDLLKVRNLSSEEISYLKKLKEKEIEGRYSKDD